MPVIEVKLVETFATPEQKHDLIVKLTDTFVGVLGEQVRPFTYVLIEETRTNQFGIAGRPQPDVAWLRGEEFNTMIEKAQEIFAEMAAPQQGSS
ncbi:MAG: tautomerase family protein [Egibacteraceae bacterium]